MVPCCYLLKFICTRTVLTLEPETDDLSFLKKKQLVHFWYFSVRYRTKTLGCCLWFLLTFWHLKLQWKSSGFLWFSTANRHRGLGKLGGHHLTSGWNAGWYLLLFGICIINRHYRPPRAKIVNRTLVMLNLTCWLWDLDAYCHLEICILTLQ